MRFSSAAALAVAATAAQAQAQRPDGQSICDHYTRALLHENTAQNQMKLLTMLVNTALVGNYTSPNVGVQVPGILTPGNVDGVYVELLPYFNGNLRSTNTGQAQGEAVSFLDGGGADALRRSQPANDSSSKQYFLLTHLYSFFGSLLHCTMQGMAGFDAYTGHGSMYQVHKFMGLNHAQVTYFILQVALAARSLGVEQSDVDAVVAALNALFNVRCAPPVVAVQAQGPQMQSVCIDAATCPEAPAAVCGQYPSSAPKPGWASGNASSSSGQYTATSTYNSGMWTSTPTPSSGAWGSGGGAGSFLPSGTSLPTGGLRKSAAPADKTANIAAVAAIAGLITLLL